MKRMGVRGVVATLVGFVLCAALLVAAPETTITVSVKSPHDKPVDNAAVILDFLGSHQITKLGKRKPIHWEVHTNQEGMAHFPPVPQGTIQLQVIAKNYETFGQRFEIDSEQKTIDIKLNPPQPQYSAHPPLKEGDGKK
ncbi:MAG: carboxypeptidase regulatory-like domain-containing protein [Acidobacteriaceae bacterium]|nr:carboxypeptidase regulatory-like domain-containing protein [Acidobacteriaceae bacterium]